MIRSSHLSTLFQPTSANSLFTAAIFTTTLNGGNFGYITLGPPITPDISVCNSTNQTVYHIVSALLNKCGPLVIQKYQCALTQKKFALKYHLYYSAAQMMELTAPSMDL